MPLSSSIVCRLQHQHRSIRELIRAPSTGAPPNNILSDEILRRPVIPGKWSAHANIAHLAAYQPVFLNRLDRIDHESSPAFGRYIAEEDPLFLAFLDKSTSSLLDSIDADRIRIITRLTGSTADHPAADRPTADHPSSVFLTKTASHPRFGLLTVTDWTEFFLLHEAQHLYTLFSLVHAPNTLRTPPNK